MSKSESADQGRCVAVAGFNYKKIRVEPGASVPKTIPEKVANRLLRDGVIAKRGEE